MKTSNSSSRVPDAAGQRHERVGELGHLRLALVHGVDLDEPGQAPVCDLAVDQLARDHADDLAAGGQRGVGDQAHQPDPRAAVHDADAAVDQSLGQGDRGLAVPRRPGRGAHEDRDAHRSI